MASWLRIDAAARVILEGGVIAYPTEAVYGIGCLPLDSAAIDRIIAIKRRDAGKGLIVVAADISQVEELAKLPQGPLRDEVLASWPGPVTWVLEARRGVPSVLTGGRPTIAVRVSAHPIVHRLCRRTGSPLVSTSANLSRHPPCRTALATRRALGSKVDVVLAGALGDAARPSEIRDAVTGATLRRG